MLGNGVGGLRWEASRKGELIDPVFPSFVLLVLEFTVALDTRRSRGSASETTLRLKLRAVDGEDEDDVVSKRFPVIRWSGEAPSSDVSHAPDKRMP